MSLTVDDVKSYLGEGFHTALRKAGDSPQARMAWQAIDEMDPHEWDSVLRFVAEPLVDYLRVHGLPE